MLAGSRRGESVTHYAMVITKIIGGLSNQMFQYAAGRGVAYRNNTPLKLDITGFGKLGGYTRWEYGLHIFTIKQDFAAPEEVGRLGNTNANFVQKLRSNVRAIFAPRNRPHRVAEKHFHFDPEVYRAPDQSYLAGYWQSEKYFSDIEDIIRKDFTFKQEPDEKNKKIIHQIRGGDTVSVHIRRRDYVTDPATAKVHGTCPLDYYRQAIALIVQKITAPKFFVFSDDIVWAQHNLKFIASAFFVDHNQQRQDYEDLRLMSYCHHHIIANSTFSWWGAWLSTHHDKVVIAPRQWFQNTNIDTRDLIPSNWITL